MSDRATSLNSGRENNKAEEMGTLRSKKEDDLRRKEEAIRISKLRLKERRKFSLGSKFFLWFLLLNFIFFTAVLIMSYIPGLRNQAFAFIGIMTEW